MPKLALRFISGKYKGGEFVLPEGRDVIIGRSSDLDVTLMEDMVSRRHAVLRVQGGRIEIQDRGSTNGTFVNGEKISKAVVGKGDRILIGTSIMKVVEADEAAPAMKTVEASNAGGSEQGRTTMHSGARSMSGTIAEVPLPDLIQLLSTSKKTGTLVMNKGGVIGKIHLDQGRIVYASTSDSPGLPPTKAMFRLLSWDDGTFDLLGPEPQKFPDQINLPTEHLLMEGLRQLDELRHAQSKLPPPETRVTLAVPLAPRLRELGPGELDVLQLVLNNRTIREVLDASASDLDAANIIAALLRKKYIQAN
jgi:pSer/pThr/pTyr-binding forkhead associated (FHA) protein